MHKTLHLFFDEFDHKRDADDDDVGRIAKHKDREEMAYPSARRDIRKQTDEAGKNPKDHDQEDNDVNQNIGAHLFDSRNLYGPHLVGDDDESTKRGDAANPRGDSRKTV